MIEGIEENEEEKDRSKIKSEAEFIEEAVQIKCSDMALINHLEKAQEAEISMSKDIIALKSAFKQCKIENAELQKELVAKKKFIY